MHRLIALALNRNLLQDDCFQFKVLPRKLSQKSRRVTGFPKGKSAALKPFAVLSQPFPRRFPFERSPAETGDLFHAQRAGRRPRRETERKTVQGVNYVRGAARFVRPHAPRRFDPPRKGQRA